MHIAFNLNYYYLLDFKLDTIFLIDIDLFVRTNHMIQT